MTQSCAGGGLPRVDSMLCYPLIPDNTPLAFIFARQRHTLTKKQLQAVADTLMSDPRCTENIRDPFHALVYARGGFFVEPSSIGTCRDDDDRRRALERKESLVTRTCLRIAERCRNSRVLKLYINKMSHDMGCAGYRGERRPSVDSARSACSLRSEMSSTGDVFVDDLVPGAGADADASTDTWRLRSTERESRCCTA